MPETTRRQIRMGEEWEWADEYRQEDGIRSVSEFLRLLVRAEKKRRERRRQWEGFVRTNREEVNQ
jgi:hypothetical protein